MSSESSDLETSFDLDDSEINFIAGYELEDEGHLVLSKSLIGHYNHSISVDTKIMVSKNFPIISEQIAVNFMAQYVTIATI